MNWGAAVRVSVACQVCCAVLDTNHSLPGEDLKNQELWKAFLLVAVSQDDEDSRMEQIYVKELGKASHDYCCSFNLCTPQGDAPIPPFLCLEGDLFSSLALKSFQNFAVCGENIYECTWFHFLLPCSLETPCWLPRRMGENKWLCSKCHSRACCIFYLVIRGIWSRLALYLIFRSAVGNTLILQLSSHIFRFRGCVLAAEDTFLVARVQSAQPTRGHFSCQRVVIAVTSQINGLLNAVINAHLKFKKKEIKILITICLFGNSWSGGEKTPPLLYEIPLWSKAFPWRGKGRLEVFSSELGGMEEHHFRDAARGGLLGDGHTRTGSSWAALGGWVGDLELFVLSSTPRHAQAGRRQQCPFWICDFVLVRAGLILISFSWV